MTENQPTEMTLEELIQTFARHHQKLIKERKETERKVSVGEIEFQEWMKDDFSIAEALHFICKEIKFIKDKMNGNK